MSDSFEVDAVTASSLGGYTSSSNSNESVVHSASRRVASRAAEDQVTLSPTAQAKLWKQEGLSVSEIAEQLGVSVSTVRAELGIEITTTAIQATSAKA